jgi:putative membrane protein
MSKRFLAAALLMVVSATSLQAQADLTDVEMAHVAVTANNIDIAYAHLALALSENAAVRRFAETMIRDHSAVNEQVAALARELGVQAQDNALSRQLLADAAGIKDRLSRLRDAEFDRAYARNELDYHRAVNGVVADAFIPNADHAKVKQAFEAALAIFRGHEKHAEMVVTELGAGKR